MVRGSKFTRLIFSLRLLLLCCATALTLAGLAYNRSQATVQRQSVRATPDGPDTKQQPVPHERGDAAAGREVFRFETFGTEGFWTDAVRIWQGRALTGRSPDEGASGFNIFIRFPKSGTVHRSYACMPEKSVRGGFHCQYP